MLGGGSPATKKFLCARGGVGLKMGICAMPSAPAPTLSGVLTSGMPAR